MDLLEIKTKLNRTTQALGAPETRLYLSMSRIAECPRVLYDQLVASSHGKPISGAHERLFALDREIKSAVRFRLQSANLLAYAQTREIFAHWNGDDEPRVCGHLDGVFNDGYLLHVKPCRADILETIKHSEHYKIPRRHFAQVQMYLRHGGYENVRLIYIARESGEFWLSEIRSDAHTQDRLDRKAQEVLRAFDRRQPAACECGRCLKYCTI